MNSAAIQRKKVTYREDIFVICLISKTSHSLVNFKSKTVNEREGVSPLDMVTQYNKTLDKSIAMKP